MVLLLFNWRVAPKECLRHKPAPTSIKLLVAVAQLEKRRPYTAEDVGSIQTDSTRELLDRVVLLPIVCLVFFSELCAGTYWSHFDW